MIDFYTTLGVERTATEEDLKKAYRDMSKLHHPDKGGDPAKFIEINTAYLNLMDPELRANHDLGVDSMVLQLIEVELMQTIQQLGAASLTTDLVQAMKDRFQQKINQAQHTIDTNIKIAAQLQKVLDKFTGPAFILGVLTKHIDGCLSTNKGNEDQQAIVRKCLKYLDLYEYAPDQGMTFMSTSMGATMTFNYR